MKKIKQLFKKYFSSLAYFYDYLRGKVFIAFVLSLFVSLLDGLGLTMFIPLLQALSDNEGVDAQEMGKMGYMVRGMEDMGLSLNVVNILLVMVLFFILKGLAVYSSEVYRIFLQESFIRKIRLKLVKNLNRLNFKSFATSDVGRIQNTMTGEVDRVSRSFDYYFETLQETVMVFVYLSFAFAVDSKFAVLVTLGGILSNFLYNNIYKHTKGASRKLTTHNSEFQGQVLQHIGHYKYLNATGSLDKYGIKLQKTIFSIEMARRKIGKLSSIGKAAREPLLVLIIAGVIAIQVLLFKGNMAAILISLLFFFRALQSLTSLQSKWNSFLEYSGSLENMRNFEQELHSNQLKDGDKTFQGFKNKIRIKNVDFKYGNQAVLKNLSLVIHKNESIAFVGESGSGKTTLVNMISGLFPVDKGTIEIDRILLHDLKKVSYQNRIGYVSQDPVIFNDSIYNNVSFWATRTPENQKRFNRCIQQASLTEFLKELPAGQETILGNNGINLSGGQKQRISIARELFKDMDILILDEATSALDSETEKIIQESIESLQGQYTILIVAHRLSTIRNADKIVYMDEGRIVDIDHFSGLIEKQLGFRRMVELQEL